MVAISFERYYVIYKPMSLRSIKLSTCVKTIALCIFMSLVWAILPLFGKEIDKYLLLIKYYVSIDFLCKDGQDIHWKELEQGI
jgi:hypothetical protein